MADVRKIEEQLRLEADPARALKERAYLKSDLEFIGVSLPKIRNLTKSLRHEQPDLSSEALTSLVGALWRTRTHEMRSVGIGLLAAHKTALGAGELRFVEEILRAANTWAHVDWLAVEVAGHIVASHPGEKKTLGRWAKDDNFWLRRSALLALLKPLRAGGGDFELFAKLAAPMLDEKEFFIRKAIGWILREVSKKRPALAFAFLDAHIARVSGLTLREGAKYLPAEQRHALLERFQAAKRRGRS